MSARSVQVVGRPVPQGSLRPFVRGNGKVVLPQSRDVLTYRNDIRAAWGTPSVHQGAAVVDLEFTFKRPKTHYRGDSLREQFAHADYTSRPDIDKLVRSVLDALTDWAWADDSQVVEVKARKSYGETESTIIKVYFIS